MPFGQMKKNPTAMQMMRNNKGYVHEHLWDTNQWDLIQLGMLHGYNTQYFERKTTTAQLRFEMKNKLNKTKIPLFNLVQIQQRAKLEGKPQLTARAYPIDVPAEHKRQMTQCLSEFFCKNPTKFAPYQMRRESPESYYNAVKFQIYYMTSQHTIVIRNLSECRMFYIEPYISQLSGVQSVVKDRQHHINGRYNILVNKSSFVSLRDTIEERLSKWIAEHVPHDQETSTRGQFPAAPMVHCPDTGNGFSDKTFITASAASYLSLDESFLKATDEEDCGNDDHRASYQRMFGGEKSNAKKPSVSQAGYTVQTDIPSSPFQQQQANKSTYSSVTGSGSETKVQDELGKKSHAELIDMVVTLRKDASQLQETVQNMAEEHSRKHQSLENRLTDMTTMLNMLLTESSLNTKDRKEAQKEQQLNTKKILRNQAEL